MRKTFINIFDKMDRYFEYLSSLFGFGFIAILLIFYHIFVFVLCYGIFFIMEVPWYIDILAITFAIIITLGSAKNIFKDLFLTNFESNKEQILYKIYLKLSREYHGKNPHLSTIEQEEEDKKKIRNLSITFHEIEKFFTEQEAENEQELEKLYLQDRQYYMGKSK